MDKYFRNSLPRGTGNSKCQPQIAVKSTFFNKLLASTVTPAPTATFASDHSRPHVPLSMFTDFENFTTLKPHERHDDAVHLMADEVIAWGRALKALRETP